MFKQRALGCVEILLTLQIFETCKLGDQNNEKCAQFLLCHLYVHLP